MELFTLKHQVQQVLFGTVAAVAHLLVVLAELVVMVVLVDLTA
jgi:hypothetical protein